VVMMKQRLDRRDFLKLAGLTVLGAGAGSLGLSGCQAASPRAVTEADLFLDCMSACGGTSAPVLDCYLTCLPELQIQPRPVSAESLAQRLALAQSLRTELASQAVDQLAPLVFPLLLRYPGWLAAGISLELFELVLENSALPEFELEGWAFEHVLPHTASIDQALAPLAELLRTPGAALSDDLTARVAEPLEALRGRLVLLGDKKLIAMAELIARVLARGNHPTKLRLTVIIDDAAASPFQAVLEQDIFDTVNWQFTASSTEWTRTVRKDIRAIDKVIMSSLAAGLLQRI
jgi:hypothetical protein